MSGIFTDRIIAGPDMSGTTTQSNDFISYYQSKGKIVRDMRGTEMDALFHAERFRTYNQNYLSLHAFIEDQEVPLSKKQELVYQLAALLSGFYVPLRVTTGPQITGHQDLLVASMVRNDVSTYIDPNSADVWIFEEPTKRGAGQVNRVIEQHRTKYGATLDPIAAALAHQAYRIDEFLRFRKILREAGKTIIRSRSEESAAYQIVDDTFLPHGITQAQYLALPGHEIAFTHPPTHIFVVCGEENWGIKEYEYIVAERGKGRKLDDHERDAQYWLLTNRRYASNWLERLYESGCTLYGSTVPQIIRFPMSDKPEITKEKMIQTLERIALE